MSDQVLKIENVTMQFGGVVAVNNLNLEINQGEIVALIGPNGAGKTTAFNVVTGVYQPTNGAVWFQDKKIIENHPQGQMRKLYKGQHDGEYTHVLAPSPDRITKLGMAPTFKNIRLWKSQTVFDNILIATHCRTSSNVFSATFRLNRKEEAAERRRVEELLAGGIPAACAVPGQPMKQSAPAKREPSAPRVESAPAERPPWEEERPPLPDEPGERVDVDETPEPSAAPEDRLVAGEAPTGGEAGRSAAADLWPGLVAAVRGKFPAVYPFLSNPAMVQGRLEDGVLTLWVKDEFTKSMVGGASILEELGRLASAQTGVPARCAVKVGKAPAAPAAAAPAQAAEHDKLDDLLAFSRQFDNIIIQE